MGMIERIPMRIDPLNRMTWINIYVLEGYYGSDQRYPVIYMFDGQNLFFDQQASFGRSWRLKEYLDQSPDAYIVVGIESDTRDDNRLHDYTPYPLDETFFGPTRGEGAKLLEWVVQVLKPKIDAQFRTWPQRQATAIAGSSMGGLMAFYAVVHHNGTFSKAACLSPSLMICQEEISRDFEGMPLDPDTRIYWSYGSLELSGLQRVEAEMILDEYAWSLKDRGGIGRVSIRENGAHNEASWGEQLGEFFHFLWNDPKDLVEKAKD